MKKIINCTKCRTRFHPHPTRTCPPHDVCGQCKRQERYGLTNHTVVRPKETPSGKKVQIALSQNQFTIVDEEWYAYLMQWKWHISRQGYAVCNVHVKGSGRKHAKSICVLMHRLILDAPEGIEVDHIDRNRLNNTIGNLRLAKRGQNAANSSLRKDKTSKYLGVSYFARDNKWDAQITVNYKSIFLGRYDTEEEAAIVRDEAALQHFGEYAHLNFPITMSHPLHK